MAGEVQASWGPVKALKILPNATLSQARSFITRKTAPVCNLVVGLVVLSYLEIHHICPPCLPGAEGSFI